MPEGSSSPLMHCLCPPHIHHTPLRPLTQAQGRSCYRYCHVFFCREPLAMLHNRPAAAQPTTAPACLPHWVHTRRARCVRACLPHLVHRAIAGCVPASLLRWAPGAIPGLAAAADPSHQPAVAPCPQACQTAAASCWPTDVPSRCHVPPTLSAASDAPEPLAAPAPSAKANQTAAEANWTAAEVDRAAAEAIQAAAVANRAAALASEAAFEALLA